MIKMIFCVKKRADISSEFFYDYWRNQHAPLVLEHREALQMRRYSQRHSGYSELGQQAIESRGMTSAYDGYAEVWWDDLETLSAALSSEQGTRASEVLATDEAKFIDLAESTISFTEEHLIFD